MDDGAFGRVGKLGGVADLHNFERCGGGKGGGVGGQAQGVGVYRFDSEIVFLGVTLLLWGEHRGSDYNVSRII